MNESLNGIFQGATEKAVIYDVCGGVPNIVKLLWS